MEYLIPTWMVALLCPKLFKNIVGQGFHTTIQNELI